jgi:ankyrin repeat protein
VNARDSESNATPLHYAASWGRNQAMEILLKHGADISAKNKSGQTPLAAAVASEQKEAATILKEHGAAR